MANSLHLTCINTQHGFTLHVFVVLGMLPKYLVHTFAFSGHFLVIWEVVIAELLETTCQGHHGYLKVEATRS